METVAQDYCPLFERLIDEDLNVSFEVTPKTLCDEKKIEELVIKDLFYLLNTRVSKSLQENFSDYRFPYSYGVSIEANLCAENPDDCSLIEEKIKYVIEKYENRLKNVQVKSYPIENDMSKISININAILLFNNRKIPVSFPLVIQYGS